MPLQLGIGHPPSPSPSCLFLHQSTNLSLWAMFLSHFLCDLVSQWEGAREQSTSRQSWWKKRRRERRFPPRSPDCPFGLCYSARLSLFFPITTSHLYPALPYSFSSRGVKEASVSTTVLSSSSPSPLSTLHGVAQYFRLFLARELLSTYPSISFAVLFRVDRS